MESWLRRSVLAGRSVLTNLALVTVAATAYTGTAWAQSSNEQLLDDVVKPDIERREINEGIIDSENFEFGFFAGVMSFEDFGSNDVYGVRLAFHVTEDWFVEGSYGLSKLQPTSYEILSGSAPILTDEQRDMSYYNINLGYNLFPGELFLGKWAFNHAFYLTLGAGNTLFADDEFFTYNFGGGLRWFTNDWIAMHFDVRNHVMTHALFGEDKEIQNLEAQVGLTLFF